MGVIATYAWTYIILPVLLKVVQKEIQDILTGMSLDEFVAWVKTIKVEPETPYEDALAQPHAATNLTLKDGTKVGG